MRDGYWFSDNKRDMQDVLRVQCGRGWWFALDDAFLEVVDDGWYIAKSDPKYKHYYLALPVEFTLSTEAEEGDDKDVST